MKNITNFFSNLYKEVGKEFSLCDKYHNCYYCKHSIFSDLTYGYCTLHRKFFYADDDNSFCELFEFFIFQ